MKFFFSGSVVIAATILASSILLSAKSSVAETLLSSFQKPTQELSQGSKQDSKQDPAVLEGSSNATSSIEGKTKAAIDTSKATPDNESAAGKSVGSSPVESAGANSTGVLTKGSEARATQATASATYTATAYSLSGRTASGQRVTKGLIAADPRVLPLGTRVRIEAGTYSGEYLVADTGGLVRGKRIDIWTPNTREALRFGRRLVKLTVLSYPAKRTAASRHRKR